MSAVCGFEAFINNKHIIGKVKEKSQAQQEYKEAVQQGKAAYLLDQGIVALLLFLVLFFYFLFLFTIPLLFSLLLVLIVFFFFVLLLFLLLLLLLLFITHYYYLLVDKPDVFTLSVGNLPA